MQARATIHLAIGPHETHAAVLHPDGSGREWQLPIGAAHPGVPLRRHPPTALELEEAIAAVEDAVMPLMRQLPPGARLLTQDAFAQVLQTGLQCGPDIPIDAVERAFDDMASVALGRPQSASAWPADAAFDGWLLVLREFMHHGAFDRITVEDPARSP